MTTLRSHVIRLAHAQPELRPHLLPLLTKTAGNIAEALLEQEAARAEARSKVIEQYLDTMAGIIPKVESADPVAGQKFESLYNKVLKEGMALAKSGGSIIKYADTVDDYEDDEKFVATRKLLGSALSDWKQNLPDHYRGAGSILTSVRMRQAQVTGGYAQDIAKWMRAMNEALFA
jgi:transketolase